MTTVSQGQSFHCSLAASDVWCAGSNGLGQWGVGHTEGGPLAAAQLPAAAQRLVVGDDHACALVSGNIYCWGSNDFSELGALDNVEPTPTQVNLLNNVTAISTSDQHTCAINDQGVWCWGDSTRGKLGLGDSGQHSEPIQVQGLPERSWRTIVTTGSRTALDGRSCVIDTLGAMYCWGSNDSENRNLDLLEAGGGSIVRTPVLETRLPLPVVGIALALEHSCALLTDNSSWCWGLNDGRLGNGEDTGGPAPPTLVVFPE
ncbi:MAG: hypothetical protein R3C68_02800 [Myxococcota bacterium]